MRENKQKKIKPRKAQDTEVFTQRNTSKPQKHKP